MSAKFSPALKALLTASHARGGAIPAPAHVKLQGLFDSITKSAKEVGVGIETVLTLSVRLAASAVSWWHADVLMRFDGMMYTDCGVDHVE